MQPRDENDDCFIQNSINRDILAVYITNPKRDGTASHDRYKRYCMASNLREAITLSVTNRLKGMSKADARVKAMDDINWDYEHGYILFPGNESLLEGHFVDARRLAHDHKINCYAETVPYADTSDRHHYGPSAHAAATPPPGSHMLSSGGDQGGTRSSRR